MTIIDRLRHDLRLNVNETLDATDKEIVKGTVTCRGCPFEEEARIENIEDLVGYAVEHAEESLHDIGEDAVADHPIGFDVSLMPLPEIKEASKEIHVGGDE